MNKITQFLKYFEKKYDNGFFIDKYQTSSNSLVLVKKFLDHYLYINIYKIEKGKVTVKICISKLIITVQYPYKQSEDGIMRNVNIFSYLFDNHRDKYDTTFLEIKDELDFDLYFEKLDNNLKLVLSEFEKLVTNDFSKYQIQIQQREEGFQSICNFFLQKIDQINTYNEKDYLKYLKQLFDNEFTDTEIIDNLRFDTISDYTSLSLFYKSQFLNKLKSSDLFYKFFTYLLFLKFLKPNIFFQLFKIEKEVVKLNEIGIFYSLFMTYIEKAY